MCNELPLVELVGLTSDSVPTARKLTRLDPDLLVLDLEPWNREAADLFDEITHQLPRCKTIVLSKKNTLLSAQKMQRAEGTADMQTTFLDPENQPGIREEIRKSVIEKHLHDACARHPAPDESVLHLYNWLTSLSQPGTTARSLQHASDRRRRHTGRRHDEWALTESMLRFQSFVEQLPGIPYLATPDVHARHIYVGSQITDVLGFTPLEWCGKRGMRTAQLHPDDRAGVLQEMVSAIDEKGGYSLEYRIADRQGCYHWVHDEAHVIASIDGAPILLQGTMLDITERKRGQEELERSHSELHELISALDALRIEEQKRLAHELHDDFGQLLAAMKIDLCTLERHLPEQSADAMKYLASINELVDAMVTSVRRILADLPPRIIEDVGLESALRSIAASFRKHHGISCHVQVNGDGKEPETRVASALYRIVQEALNNVVKHARATSVHILLEYSVEHIVLRIADNGVGMQREGAGKPGSFGLIGMRERAEALAGSITIDAQRGKGTVLKVKIPVSAGVTAAKPKR